MSFAREGRRGFTLLELLVAIAVFSISILAFYGSFTRAAELRSLAAERARLAAVGRRVVDRLESDLRGAGDSGYVRSDLPLFLAPAADSFSLADERRLLLDLTTWSARGVTAPEALWTLEDGPADRGDQARVRWFLTREGSLLRSELRPPRVIDERDPPPAEIEFATGIASLAFRFWDGREWRDDWDAAASPATASKLPLFVETSLVLEGDDVTPLELVSTVRPAMAEVLP
jgi:type II secretion system protein J